jgi:hypothetical protein
MLVNAATASASVAIVHDLEEALLNLRRKLMSRKIGLSARWRKCASLRHARSEAALPHLSRDLLGCFPNDVV